MLAAPITRRQFHGLSLAALFAAWAVKPPRNPPAPVRADWTAVPGRAQPGAFWPGGVG